MLELNHHLEIIYNLQNLRQSKLLYMVQKVQYQQLPFLHRMRLLELVSERPEAALLKTRPLN